MTLAPFFTVGLNRKSLIVNKCFLLPLVLFGCLSGCGGVEEFPRAQATGRVVCEGKPVPKVLVTFEVKRTGGSGLVGQLGTAVTDEEGKFVISTYGTKDGAVIGKHMIRAGKTETTPPCNCAINDMTVQMEVDVTKEGPNNFEVTLAKKSAKNKDGIIEED